MQNAAVVVAHVLPVGRKAPPAREEGKHLSLQVRQRWPTETRPAGPETTAAFSSDPVQQVLPQVGFNVTSGDT